MIEILGKTRFDFVGKWKIALALSGTLSVLGLLAALQVGLGKANLGIDFAGGTAVQLRFEKPVRIEEARRVVTEGGLPNAEIQEFTEGNKLLIRVKAETTIQEKVADRVVSVFKQQLPDHSFVVDSSTEIGPTVGQKLQKDALVAVTIAMVGIILYIAARFEFRFGLAAAIATFHDVLAVLGIVYLLGKEINLLIVTALLTIAGYSLTDTVVVFDRIRENLKTRHREPLALVINSGINQVLSRTIVVALTSLLAVVALIFFGGEVLHDFSLALFLGVGVGLYSSIFVASPLLLLWQSRGGRLTR